MNRREFIVKTSSTLLGAGLAAKAGIGRGIPVSPGSSRVIEVYHPGSVLGKRRVDKETIRLMLQRGLESLTGSKKPWADFLDPGDRIGLKINRTTPGSSSRRGRSGWAPIPSLSTPSDTGSLTPSAWKRGCPG